MAPTRYDDTNYIQKYADAIRSGEIMACEKVKAVVFRLADECKETGGKYHFDIEKASRPIAFVERFCRQSKGEQGQRLKLQLFQKVFIQATFGFVDDEGKRRYSEVLIIVARKNGKSVLLSALALYCMIADHEGGAEVDCVASKKDQARIVFNEARNMVLQSPHLAKHIRKRKSDMYSDFNFGVFQPLSSDSNTLDGLNPSCGIIDELHSIKDRNIYDVVKQAMTARRQPLLFIITTSGFNREGIYDTMYDYASRVITGDVKGEHFLPFVYELDNEPEWTDPAMWIKANPGLGTIKSYAGLRDNVERAKVDSSFRPTVLTKDFNLKSTVAASWLSWEELNNEATFDMEEVRDTYAIGGCDLSATTDLTAATLIIRKAESDTIYVLQQYFLPESRIEHLEKTSSKEAPYRKWAERGLLTICEGNMVKYSDVTAWFMRMRDEYSIDLWRLGYDRALAGYWAEEMSGVFGLSVMEKVAQGPFTWSAPMKELGAMLGAKKINYNNNPILKWCLSNTGVKSSGTVESIQPIKIRAAMRIDGMVSLLNAYTIYTKYREDYINLIGG